MKHLKTFISLCAAILLLAACTMLEEPGKPAINNGTEVARVKVDIGGNARTILPDFDWNFSKYVLSAAPAGDNTQTAPEPATIDGTDNWGYIYVPYGDWIITVTAYVKVGAAEYAAAKGSAPLSVWGDYQSVNIPVNLPQSGGTGTFSYTVTYPSPGTASVKLAPLSGITPGFNLVFNESVSSPGTTVNKSNIASGMFFLTVSATSNGKTVTRSEVVHIYPQLTSRANYAFTKLDFGADSLQIGGTINVKVNGQQPDYAYLNLSFGQNGSSRDSYINFTGNDGSGTWNFNMSNLPVGVNTMYFSVVAYSGGDNVILNHTPNRKELSSFPLPLDDKTDINLGPVTFTVDTTSQPLAPNSWRDGIITERYGVKWYSINVTAGMSYYLWWNGRWSGDGSKTMPINVYAWYSNGNEVSLSDNYNAWNDPAAFTAESAGMVYIRVSGWEETGTYAIAYSTDSRWFNNSFPDLNSIVTTPLSEDAWVHGEITTSRGVKWYSMNVSAGQTYQLWWNDGYDGDGDKTLDIDVYAWYRNETAVYLSRHDSAYWDPAQFTAAFTGTVYIRVRAYDGWNDTGTYAIRFTLPRSRVQAYIVTTAFETNSNLYLYTWESVYKGDGLFVYIDDGYYWYSASYAYMYYIDGVLKYSDGESGQYLPTSDLSAGNHTGLAVVTINDIPFSRSFSFTVYE